MEVGTSQGSVHHQQQGTGLATVLQGQGAVTEFSRLAAEQRAVGRAADEEKAKNLNSAYDRMIKFNPEHWYKHDNQIQEGLDNWYNVGVGLLNKGVDPWKSVDPESTKFRENYLALAGLASGSKQLQERFNAVRGKIDGAEPDKYTQKSLNQIADFYEMPLEEIVRQGLVPPELEQRRPMVALQDYFSKVMQPLNQTRNGNPYTDAELWDVAKRSVVDPEKGDDLADSFKSAYAQMDEVDQKSITRRAQANGVSVPQQMAFDYAQRYSTQQKPFDYNEWKKGAVDRIKVPYKEWRGIDGFSKKVDKAELDKIANTVARDQFVADPRALMEYESILPRKTMLVQRRPENGPWGTRTEVEVETDGSYRQRAIAHLAEQLKSEVSTDELSGLTERGGQKKEVAASQNTWIQDIMSMDTDRSKEAIGYLMSSPGIFPGLTVQNGAIYEDKPGERVLKLYLAGNLEYAKVKSTMEQNGFPIEVDAVEPRSTYTVVSVPVTTQTENALLRLHDHAFEDTKLPYSGARNTTKPDIRSLVSPPQPINKNVSTPTKNRY